MRPTIREGERITVSPAEPKEFRLGDILLYTSRRGLIAHRIVGRAKLAPDRLQFIPRGDAAHACDDPVAGQQALGRVVTVERNRLSIDLAGWGAKLSQWVWVQRARLLRSVERAAAALHSSFDLQPESKNAS
jgi:hypothetical protein